MEACYRLAKAFGMPAPKKHVRFEEKGDRTVLRWEGVYCEFDGQGRVRSLSGGEDFQPKRNPVLAVKSADQALQIAKTALKSAGHTLPDPISVSPPGKWDQRQLQSANYMQLATVVAPSKAHGIPAWGVLGGYEIRIDTLRAKVTYFRWDPLRTPVKPVVKVAKQRAIDMALNLLNPLKRPKDGYDTVVRKGYHWPERGIITPAGQKFVDGNRVPYCWMITLATLWVTDPRPGDSYRFLTVVIDAATGDILVKPR